MTQDKTRGAGLFPALLKYWRGQRGVSQLDLALTAGISARHVSFMETGRAKPSEDMVFTVCEALDVPLRARNALLQAAGFEIAYAEPSIDEVLSGPIGEAVERMMAHHEPFPMIAMDRHYNMLRANAGALRLISRFLPNPERLGPRPNVVEILFDPEMVRPFVADWQKMGRALMTRLHRDALRRPDDDEVRALIERLLAFPDVPESFRHPDFGQPSGAAFNLRFRRDDVEMAFLTTVTRFAAPQNITLEELQIESYFPLDDETRAICQQGWGAEMT
ncbi:MAG: helix-turn-helix domain-containing protein [Bradymonadia bacterium]